VWSLNEFKRVLYAVGLIGIIICFAPSFVKIVAWPAGGEFSDIYVLGPGHMVEDYPFNVSAHSNYLVYLGVENHMGNIMYYEVDVKFRNASEPLPNGTVPSPLPVLYGYRFFLEDGQDWEGKLTFSFSDVVFVGKNSCTVGKMQVNNVEFQMDKTASWNNANSGFYYQLIMELWLYNQTNDGLSYDGRFVSLWLNATSR
jgi:hypothetical protein